MVKNTKTRTQVKELPKRKKELSRDEKKKVKGGKVRPDIITRAGPGGGSH